jgi:hypothetical protein
MPFDADALQGVAKRLHAHYDVEPELGVRDGARNRTATLVRLWGVHRMGARALPGCPKSREIASGLTAVARYVLDHEDGMDAELEPLTWALYVSRVVPGADEIALGIRIARRTADRTPQVFAAEERCLRRLRARLRELGVPERY